MAGFPDLCLSCAYAVTCSAYSYPDARVLRHLFFNRLYPGPLDIFTTNMTAANTIVVPVVKSLKSLHGHIVIRVAPG
jgi:hypothetical protein